MEAKDLMIGDWFNFLIDIEGGDTEYDPKNEIYQPMQVDNIEFGDATSEEGVTNDARQLQPIPLTAEILGKNFSSTPGWYFIGTNKYCFRIYKYKDKWDLLFRGDGKGTRLNLKISYVHQLQHALRLCNIDKEIEL